MTVEQLEQEHKKLVIQLHPDRNPNDPEATAKFQEMQQQYEERKAELAGDYTKARKGRERREREARERAERERKERERRKVEMAVEQARKNKSIGCKDYQAGFFIYVRKVNKGAADMVTPTMEELTRQIIRNGTAEEVVVMIETVVDMDDQDFFTKPISNYIPDGVWGGWETLQQADPASGVMKPKRVAKVVMFRCRSGETDFCVFGNPMGDQIVSDYYMPHDYQRMYDVELRDVKAWLEREAFEKARLEAERKAKLLAEQKPLIEEWQEKLIAISAGLSDREKQEVAVANLKTMLKAKFPGTTFKFRTDKYSGGYYDIQWEDGPTVDDVDAVQRLFDPCIKYEKNLTPWEERFGHVYISGFDRKMSVLTKAKILQQLGSVTEAFSTSAIDDEVNVSDFDWMMLHLLVGIEVGKGQRECMSTMHDDGSRTVSVMAAVRFVFQHSSYAKATKTKTKKAA